VVESAYLALGKILYTVVIRTCWCVICYYYYYYCCYCYY